MDKGITLSTGLESMAEEIKALLVEAEFTSRSVMIEAYHEAGTMIIRTGGDRSKLVQNLAKMVDRSERTLWYAVKFAEMYPTIDKLPDGKNISWHKIITRYLTAPKEKGDCQHEPVLICKKCKKIIN